MTKNGPNAYIQNEIQQHNRSSGIQIVGLLEIFVLSIFLNFLIYPRNVYYFYNQ